VASKRLHGAHVPHRKNTAQSEPRRLPVPAMVTIPMSMHIGAPAKPVVKVGDEVKVGQLIGEPGGFVSAPILPVSPVRLRKSKISSALPVLMFRQW